MNTNIAKILIMDKVLTGLQEKYGIGEDAANKIVAELLGKLQEMSESGASVIELAKYLIDSENEIAEMQNKIDRLADVSDIIVSLSQ